jgi:N-acetyl sugar amidotransferase
MDTTDPDIEFDTSGVCNHCHDYNRLVREYVVTGKEGRKRLEAIVAEIKKEGIGKDYDCLIGVSGGVDSTFVAYQTKKMGLRPLAIHLDNGWNSELAVSNVQKAIKALNIDLHTYVIDWEEFKDLQIAFLKASTPDSEVPTDHAIVSLMYQIADKMNIKYVFIGRNVRTETHVPLAWSQGHFDWKYIENVHRMFGMRELKTYPHRTRKQDLYYNQRQNWVNVLDCIDYVKKDAIRVLEQELGWQYYGGKHYESIYTRFFQGYILPKKFGYDKRKGHFSSLICSGEMTREKALEELKKEPYPIEMQMEDRAYVIKKLGLTENEFEEIMQLPKKTILDYPSYARDNQYLIKRKQFLLRLYRRCPNVIKFILDKNMKLIYKLNLKF